MCDNCQPYSYCNTPGIAINPGEQNQMRQPLSPNKSTRSSHSLYKSQTNNSPSKQAHAFSRTPRFTLPQPPCPELYYAGEPVKSRREGAGIGRGTKSDFTKDLTVSPGSSRYVLRSELEQNASKKKGYTVALSREKVRLGQYINPELSRTPSADKYKISLALKQQAPAYSMRTRTKQLHKTMSIEPQNDNPGPSDYDNPLASSDSMRKISNYSTISYGTSRSSRFPKEAATVPGPGQYQQVSGLSSVGKYIVSAHQGGTIAKFANSRRLTEFDLADKRGRRVPGVGAYQMPSEFGQYV